MKVNTILDGDVFETFKDFFVKLFEENVIDYLLVPQRMAGGRTLTQTLVSGKDLDDEKLENINPFSPVMPANSATIVAQISKTRAGKKIGVVIKPCEIRALVELVKLEQGVMDNLVIIGTDCAGTFEIEAYARYFDAKDQDAEDTEKELLGEIYSGETDYEDDETGMKLRSSCQICNAFTPELADITLNLLGMDDQVYVSLEKKLAEQLGLDVEDDEPDSHKDAVGNLFDDRNYKREEAFDEFKEKLESMKDMADVLATCTRCYACQSACPVCYCRVCFFKTETFEPDSDRFLRWADKEGALHMPTETLLFHLTRMNHMAASCIGCGMCESSCARGIPLSTLFQVVGDEVQKKLEYEPGKRLEDPIPLSSFNKEDM